MKKKQETEAVITQENQFENNTQAVITAVLHAAKQLPRGWTVSVISALQIASDKSV